MLGRKLYKLTTRLVSNEEGTKKREGIVFEWMLAVKYLGQKGKNSTIYDSELRMHFENKSALAYQYEVEFVDNQVLCSSRLEKAESFIRRCIFRHDWLQLSINGKGMIVSVDNISELDNRWQKIKKSLQKDYRGVEVDNHLAEIDKSFEDKLKFLAVVYQYLGFGLIFPQIPHKHNDDWEAKRLVKISEYEDEKFEEHIFYEGIENSNRSYRISGNELLDNKFKISKYEGYIQMPVNSLLPVESEISVNYHNDGIKSEWEFKLNKIE